MRDEAHGPRQRNMPFINTLTQSAYINQVGVSSPPAITSPAKEPETPPFVLGVDTCGFTTGSTRKFERVPRVKKTFEVSTDTRVVQLPVILDINAQM
jgi:hypothetical protein